MSLMNTHDSYGSITRALHWLLAMLLIAMLTVGLLLGTIGSPFVYQVHKLTGLTVLIITIITIGWNICNEKPDYPASMPVWQLTAAKIVQHTMLLCALIMPLTGWFFSTAAGKPPQIGSLILAMPNVGFNHILAHKVKEIHTYVAYILIALISMHTLAALAHHYILKDNVLRRMLK